VRWGKVERFKELCEQAEVEDDPKKLARVTAEINELLKAEVKVLKRS
jgi:hypothetical protein